MIVKEYQHPLGRVYIDDDCYAGISREEHERRVQRMNDCAARILTNWARRQAAEQKAKED